MSAMVDICFPSMFMDKMLVVLDFLFKTLSLAKGVLFGNFNRVKSRQGYGFLGILVKEMLKFGNFGKKPNFFGILVEKMRKFGKFCLENANSEHF